MPRFFHERKDAKDLFEVVAGEKGLNPFVVEKDYWVMHCLWGLHGCGLRYEMKGGTSLSKGWGIIHRFSEDIDIQFEAARGLDLKSDKPRHVTARLRYFDDLTEKIRMPDIFVERDRARDDRYLRNIEIMLKYESHFDPVPGVKPWVLLEVGFDKTQPNEVRPVTSWVLDRAMRADLDIIDNRVPGVAFFLPEYTFVDKIQTVCRKFRQFRKDALRFPPGTFMRHYYDMFMLLDCRRVRDFIGKPEYRKYLAEKLTGADKAEFEKGDALRIPDGPVCEAFRSGYDSLEYLFFEAGPSFDDIRSRISGIAASL